MALQLTNPIEVETIFTELDPSGDFKAMFRQATAKEVQRRDRIVFSPQQRYLGAEGIAITGSMPWSERQMIESMITISSCVGLNDHRGRPLFRFKNGALDMTDAEFIEAWGAINIPGVAEALHKACLTANPDWDWVEHEEGDENPPPAGAQDEE